MLTAALSTACGATEIARVAVAVLGFGNSLRRDDGVGLRLAERVGERWGNRLSVLTGQQPVPEWAHVLAEMDVAFMLDASPGVQRPRMRRLRPTFRSLDAHTFGPAELLALTQAVYARAPRCYLLLLPAIEFDFGESLSPPTAESAELGLRLLERRLRELVP